MKEILIEKIDKKIDEKNFDEKNCRKNFDEKFLMEKILTKKF